MSREPDPVSASAHVVAQNARMRLDHLSYAAGPDGLPAPPSASGLSAVSSPRVASTPPDPQHGPAAGRPRALGCRGARPPPPTRPFGAVRARSVLGGGWFAGPSRSTTSHRSSSDRASVRGGTAIALTAPAALEADRRQRSDRGPAAAVLRPVAQSRGAPPADGGGTTGRWHAWRSPATRNASASGSARPSSRLWRTSGRWVAPHGTPGIIAAQFQTPSGLVRV
jgi:hypothetical protein